MRRVAHLCARFRAAGALILRHFTLYSSDRWRTSVLGVPSLCAPFPCGRSVGSRCPVRRHRRARNVRSRVSCATMHGCTAGGGSPEPDWLPEPSGAGETFRRTSWGALRAVGEIRFARGAGDASASCTRPGALLVRKTQALSPASGPALHLCLSARGRSSSRGRTRCRQASRILACAPHEGAAGVCRRSLRESPVRAPDRTASLIRDLSSRFLALFPLRREGGSDTRSGRQHALPRERDFAGGAGGVRSCRSASDAGAGPLRRTRSVANARSKDAVWRTL